MVESNEELKSHLMKVKEESEKVGLKLIINKLIIQKLTSWNPVPSLHGETVETVIDSILGGSKITADLDCSHELAIKDACSLEEKL